MTPRPSLAVPWVALLTLLTAGAVHAQYPPPSKRRVVLSIPRPSREVTDFGDVDGDGKPEELSTTAGVRAVLTWYVKDAHRRFDAARFAHLELWGFYWMHEAIGLAEEGLARAAAEIVHSLGVRFLWIPWFRAPGWDRWRECGFDVALLQPNYAFFSQHRGRVRRSRLAQAAQLARAHGLGVEIELPMFCNDPATVSYFRRYLADGAASRYGYQAASTAYYLGVNNLERLCHSKIDWQRALYDALAAYVRGQLVPDPDPRPTWQVAGKPVPTLSDGLRLTDGIIAHRFSPTALTGWADDAPRTITIDLGAERSIRRVVAWALGGGKYGIFAPTSVEMQTSMDGRTWCRPPGSERRSQRRYGSAHRPGTPRRRRPFRSGSSEPLGVRPVGWGTRRSRCSRSGAGRWSPAAPRGPCRR